MQLFRAATLLGFSLAAAEEFGTETVRVDILGQSGKFRLYGAQAGLSDPNLVTIELDALKELDIDGNSIGNTGPQSGKHSINSFASQDFQFGSLESDVLLGWNESIHARAHRLSFESAIGEVGQIAVDTMVVTSEGLVGPEGDQWTAGLGDLKFNIRFPNWNWCDGTNCGSDVGAFLELDIKMKGNLSSVQLIPGTTNTYDLGGGANLTLTNLVKITDLDTPAREVEMASPPSIVSSGNSQIFRFRFPKFTSSAEYDPLLRQGWHWGQVRQSIYDGLNNADGAAISGSTATSSFSMLTTLLILTGLVASS